ncbi:hypothetical protein FRC09_005079 [Ceratobasidium sp. 395]|nr:hypothetical protein FRC09_005079 [Ceratobasidium sp. 395]
MSSVAATLVVVLTVDLVVYMCSLSAGWLSRQRGLDATICCDVPDIAPVRATRLPGSIRFLSGPIHRLACIKQHHASSRYYNVHTDARNMLANKELNRCHLETPEQAPKMPIPPPVINATGIIGSTLGKQWKIANKIQARQSAALRAFPYPLQELFI